MSSNPILEQGWQGELTGNTSGNIRGLTINHIFPQPVYIQSWSFEIYTNFGWSFGYRVNGGPGACNPCNNYNLGEITTGRYTINQFAESLTLDLYNHHGVSYPNASNGTIYLRRIFITYYILPTATPTMTPTTISTETPTATTLADYGITPVGNWDGNDLNEMLLAVTRIGEAFVILSESTVAPHIKFKEVMGVENANGIDQGNITVIRGTGSTAICIVDNNVRTITCDTLFDHNNNQIPFTQYVFVHEFGHVFDNQADRDIPGGVERRALREYIQDTRLAQVNMIFDSRGLVMGMFVTNTIDGPVWRRGERGWGSGPGSIYSINNDVLGNPTSQVFTNFQQNPAPYGDNESANQETAADMFLNWVYRITGSGGFLNYSWKPNDANLVTFEPCNISGCLETNPAQPGVTLHGDSGDARFTWFNTHMISIFEDHNWK